MTTRIPYTFSFPQRVFSNNDDTVTFFVKNHFMQILVHDGM
nr:MULTISPECIES: hypothetical protein [unclassified Eikenella]